MNMKINMKEINNNNINMMYFLRIITKGGRDESPPLIIV